MWILKILACNLAIVFVIELSLGVLLGAKTVRKIATMVLVNIITNPAVVLSGMCFTLFLSDWENIGICILEILVVVTEGFMFRKFRTFDSKNPYLISFVLNFASFVTGEIINIFL